MTSLTDIDTARDIATKAHAGATRENRNTGETTPYIDHVLRVQAMVGLWNMSHDAHITALLHDVLEDTDTTSADLKAAGISPEVIEAVEAISRRDGEVYTDFIDRVAGNELARAVKLSDLRDNMRDLPHDDTLRDRYKRAQARLEN